MIIETKPLAEVVEEAIRLLVTQMGPANAARVINYFSIGYGDYTKERKQFFANYTVDDIIREIELDFRPEDIKKLSLAKIAIEIGKIELKLSQPTRETVITKKVTQAPEPVNPVGGSNMPPRSLGEATTQSEYEAMRRSQTSKSNGFI